MEECFLVKIHLTCHSWTNLEQAAFHILNVNMNFAIATCCHSDFLLYLYSASPSSMKDNMSTVHKPPAHLLWGVFFPKDKKKISSVTMHSDAETPVTFWCFDMNNLWTFSQCMGNKSALSENYCSEPITSDIYPVSAVFSSNNCARNSTTMLLSQLWILQKRKYNK